MLFVFSKGLSMRHECLQEYFFLVTKHSTGNVNNAKMCATADNLMSATKRLTIVMAKEKKKGKYLPVQSFLTHVTDIHEHITNPINLGLTKIIVRLGILFLVAYFLP